MSKAATDRLALPPKGLRAEVNGAPAELTEEKYDDVEEALPCLNGLLPHQHDDLGVRFPRAHVQVPGEDRPQPDALEQRGITIGLARARQCALRKRGSHIRHATHEPREVSSTNKAYIVDELGLLQPAGDVRRDALHRSAILADMEGFMEVSGDMRRV